jgi:hypothetical protein
MPPAPPPAAAPASTELTVRRDPKYAPYVKMLNLGVPLPAVKIKMNAEGLNPAAVEYGMRAHTRAGWRLAYRCMCAGECCCLCMCVRVGGG